MEILFWRHQSRLQKTINLCSIYCRVTVDGKRVELGSTNIEIPFDDFDTKRQQVLETNTHSMQYNLILQEEFKSKIMMIYTDFMMKKKEISAKAIKEVLFGDNSEKKIGLIVAYDKFIEFFRDKTKETTSIAGKDKEPRRTLASIKPLNTCRAKLLKYLIDTKQLNIQLNDLNEAFFDNYEEYLFRIGHEHSTVRKHLSTFKQMTSWAKRKELIDHDPFEDVLVGRDVLKDPNYLNEYQFKRWANHRFSSEMLQEVADVFVLYCRTGLHYLDLKQVIENPNRYLKVGIDKKTWIFKPRQKTNVVAKIPIEEFPEIAEIVKKYGGWSSLPIKSNAKMNELLKLCVIELNLFMPENQKIYEKLSVKHGRCTMTDFWFNELGGRTESLLPILGRKSADGLERYGKPDERAVLVALRNRKEYN